MLPEIIPRWTGASRDVNAAIFASSNVRGALLEGRVSGFLVVARPSRRLCPEDAPPPSGTTRSYAAVIVPYCAADPAPAVAAFDLAQDREQFRCAFALNGRPYVLAWSGTGLAKVQ